MIRIKICGVTAPADAVFAAESGADALGLNFHPDSPRRLVPQQAASIVRALPPFVAPVGLFVHTPIEHIGLVVADLGLRAVQSYGQPPGVDYFPAAHTPAFRVKSRDDLAAVSEYVTAARERGNPPAAVVIDSFVPGVMGGTGHTAPWGLLAGFDPGVPVILAGGLTPDNVAGAIRTVRPWGVDVASGVESAPGVKDRGKVRAFVQAVRAAAAEREPGRPLSG